jgi:hypothetical protein
MTRGSVSFRLVTSRISVFGSKLGSNTICISLSIRMKRASSC